jgi:hypothetical protein
MFTTSANAVGPGMTHSVNKATSASSFDKLQILFMVDGMQFVE